MSGISGIWNIDGKPIETALLKSIGAQLGDRGVDGEYSWVAGPVALSCQLLRSAPESVNEVQPAVHERSVVVFDGRLDDRDELISRLGTRGFDDGTPSPILIAAAYQKWGEEFVVRLNGDFAIALYDGNQQKLLLARDAIGPRPLYYFRTDTTVVFASEVKALLAHPSSPRGPNREALAEYLIGAQGPQSETTFFEGIHRVIPAHTTVFTHERVVTRKYWDFDPSREVRLKSFEEYAEALKFYFERAVQRRIRSSYPVGVFVSGGLDSSAIFCVAETLRSKGTSPCPELVGGCHSGPPGTPADETEFVEYIERDFGTKIARIERAVVRSLSKSLAKIAKTEAPELELLALDNDALAERLRAQGVRTILTGQWGDQVLSTQTYLVDLVYRMRWPTVYKHLREYRRWIVEAAPYAFVNIFRNELAADLVTAHGPKAFVHVISRIRARAVSKMRACKWYTADFRREAQQAGAKHGLSWRAFPTAASRTFYKNLRGSSWLGSEEYDNKWISQMGMDIAIPFLDRELISFGLAIPVDMQVWQGVPKALFRCAMNGILPPEIQWRRSKGDVTDLVNESMTACFDELLGLLERSTIGQQMGIVDAVTMRQELTRMKAELKGDNALAAWRMQGLAGLEQWLQTFFPERSVQLNSQPTMTPQ